MLRKSGELGLLGVGCQNRSGISLNTTNGYISKLLMFLLILVGIVADGFELPRPVRIV